MMTSHTTLSVDTLSSWRLQLTSGNVFYISPCFLSVPFPLRLGTISITRALYDEVVGMGVAVPAAAEGVGVGVLVGIGTAVGVRVGVGVGSMV